MADYTEFGHMLKPEDRQLALALFTAQRLIELDAAIFGYTDLSLNGLTGNQDVAPTVAQKKVIRLTGAPSGAVTLKMPTKTTGARAENSFVNAMTGANSTVTIKSQGANGDFPSGLVLATGRQRMGRNNGDSIFPFGAETEVATGNIVAGNVIVPRAHAYHSVAQATVHNTELPLALGSEAYDNDAIHDNVTNNSRLACKTPGDYDIFGGASFAASAVGSRYIVIKINGVAKWYTVLPAVASAGVGTTLPIGYSAPLALNDYVQLFAWQDSGGGLNVNSCFLVIEKV
jgi:hypothetical protein